MNKTIRSFAIVIVLILLSSVHLSIFNQNIDRSYDIVKLNKKLEALIDVNRFLNYKVAQKESLDRIENIATKKLKMIYPKEIKYMTETTREAE